MAGATPESASPGVETPETYLGYERAERFLPKLRPGTSRYSGRASLPPSHFSLRGVWRVRGEAAAAVRSASINAQFVARKAFLVLSSTGGPRRVRVLLDGRPIRPSEAGADVRDGRVLVNSQRLYSLVSLPGVERRRLTLEFERGVSGYAFTFG